ncbi:hypothetical protein GF376_02475 [Candidatus Peregrinibacteria bacterium]|nr:hypothetical protein [Candidatus Peregrinibacteria bacterium]
MTTKIIGIKEFRRNITSMWKEARQKNIRFIVMHHSTPVFEVNPIKEDELILERFAKDISIARKQVQKGQIQTFEDTYKELGLDEL